LINHPTISFNIFRIFASVSSAAIILHYNIRWMGLSIYTPLEGSCWLHPAAAIRHRRSQHRQHHVAFFQHACVIINDAEISDHFAQKTSVSIYPLFAYLKDFAAKDHTQAQSQPTLALRSMMKDEWYHIR